MPWSEVVDAVGVGIVKTRKLLGEQIHGQELKL